MHGNTEVEVRIPEVEIEGSRGCSEALDERWS